MWVFLQKFCRDRQYQWYTHGLIFWPKSSVFYGYGKLWQQQTEGHHKLVAFLEMCMNILHATHDEVTHKGYFAMSAHIAEHFWWPNMLSDIALFVKTCLLCQLQQTQQILILPMVPLPAPLQKCIWTPCISLPLDASSTSYRVTALSLTGWNSDVFMQRQHTYWVNGSTKTSFVSGEHSPRSSPTMGLHLSKLVNNCWRSTTLITSVFQDTIHGWTVLLSDLTSIQQALFKVALGDQLHRSQSAHSVFWADHIMTWCCMGCSPYFTTTGTHPILLIDIVETSYLIPPPDAPLSSTELIANRALTLQKWHNQVAKLHSKVYTACVQATICFKQDHTNIIKDFNFQPGDLVLTCNTAIEKALSCKMHARYLGPLIVISRNQGKVYILAELDGSVLEQLVATFWVLPFFARKTIPIADLHSFIDISQTRLTKMEASYGQGNNNYKAPLDFNGDNSDDINESSPNSNWPPSRLGTVSILVRGRGTTKYHSFFQDFKEHSFHIQISYYTCNMTFYNIFSVSTLLNHPF